MSSSGAGGKLEKASITILNGSNSGTEIICKFNPNEYTIDKNVNYGEKEATGAGTSVLEFVDGQAETLSMELFFDTTDTGKDVRTEYINDVDLLLEVDGELHAPPVCQFVWGKGISFTAVVDSAQKQFTKFLPSGVPVRARVNLTFQEYKTTEFANKEIKKESTDKTKVWTVSEGDTLWLVASEEYGDPNYWRTIASKNDIEDPRQLQSGEQLELPPL